MLKERLLTALVGIPFAVVVIYLGGWALLVVTGILIAIANWEFQKIARPLGNRVPWILTTLYSVFMLIAAYRYEIELSIFLGLYLLILLALVVFRYPNFKLAEAGISLLMLVYIGLFFTQFFLLRTLEGGGYFLLFLLVANWASDTGAYFSGRAFGKNKLAPSVSPKKTIEGSIGGVILALVVGVLMSFQAPVGRVELWALLAVLIAIVGQLGDLAESAFKREAGIKDSSQVLPGHGGILDRFDSVLMTSPVAYYYIKLFIF